MCKSSGKEYLHGPTDGLCYNRGVFYRIERTGVRIVGTVPALTSDQPELPSWLCSVFERSDRLIFEADVEAVDPASEQLPTNQSLSVLSFFDLVAALWLRLGIAGRPGRFKAWAAAAQMTRHLCKQLAPGVDALLIPEAKRRQPPPHFLEITQDRVAAHDAVSLDEQLTRLEHVVTQPEEAAAFDEAVHAAWLAQNIDAIARLLDSQRKVYPETFLHLLDNRNKKWLPQLLPILQENTFDGRPVTTLIAVGAVHLCGEQGLISLLTKEGHTVTRLL